MNDTTAIAATAACGTVAAVNSQNPVRRELRERLAALWPEARRIKVRVTRHTTSLRVHITRRFSYHALGRTPEGAMAKLIRSAEENPYRPE